MPDAAAPLTIEGQYLEYLESARAANQRAISLQSERLMHNGFYFGATAILAMLAGQAQPSHGNTIVLDMQLVQALLHELRRDAVKGLKEHAAVVLN